MLIFGLTMFTMLRYGYLLLLISICHMLEAQGVRQSYRLLPGETYMLDIEIQQNTHSESTAGDEVTLYSRSQLEFTVDSVTKPDLVHMSVHYGQLSLSMLAPAMNLDINSGSGSSQLLTAMMDSLERSPFHIITDARGALLQQEGLDEVFKTMATIPVRDTNELNLILNTIREVYGPDAFSSLYGLFVTIYPVIQPMNNWTHDVTYFFNTKAVQMVNRYQLARTTEEVMIIQGLGMINAQEGFREQTDLGRVESVVTGSQTYDFQMDLHSGWLKQCVSRQRLMIETTILESRYLPKGLKIPSYTETLFEITGSKL
jgi:hypothetical protein